MHHARQAQAGHAGIGFFVSPAVLIVGIFFLYPLVMTGWMSLHDWPLLGVPEFIGLENYATMVDDQKFWSAMGFTLIYTVVVTMAIFAVAFPLALFVDQPRRLIGVYRTAFFLPVVVGLGSASLLWVWLLNVDTGLFSPALKMLGLVERPKALLGQFDTAFISIVVMVVWKIAGFTMVILLTGLQSIPHELKEAARIDGAGPFRIFFKITFPLMRRTFALALVLSVAGSILAFDQFYIMTSGGPRNSTITAVYWIFNTSFVQFKLGYGAALSIVLLAVLVLLSVLQLIVLRDKEAA
ncbi:carbohydrate ABC transporter permease [Devosia sp.]|uniref:carbohydrate ABC transporter permease n=1 Tax=Devosia sp. TaxID=1871048 RepID=UPI0025F23758|nr:sugar ABC transporter permease [Devosia sp.]MCR6633472.1 sugar ABC transporter permease [Devosia sp.]